MPKGSLPGYQNWNFLLLYDLCIEPVGCIMTLRTLGFFTCEKLVKSALRAGVERYKAVGSVVTKAGRRWSNSTGSGGNILKVAKFVVGQERRCILVLFARRGN